MKNQLSGMVVALVGVALVAAALPGGSVIPLIVAGAVVLTLVCVVRGLGQ